MATVESPDDEVWGTGCLPGQEGFKNSKSRNCRPGNALRSLDRHDRPAERRKPLANLQSAGNIWPVVGTSGGKWWEMALTGTYERSLDDKRRLAFPKKLLDEFAVENLSSLYIAPGTEKSLAIYSPQGFDRLARKIARKGTNLADTRNYTRLFYARAEKVDLDAQSRVRIPDRLAELAGLGRDVVLLGVNDRAEVWDATRWREFQDAQNPGFDEMATRAFEGL